jgi:transposase
MTRAKRSRKPRDLAPVHPKAAAIDIGATLHVAAVGPECDPEPVRTFGTFTGDVHRLAEWFKRCGITTVAMESTGVYWIPAYEVLEQHGFEVILVNARDARHVPGRKTDVCDAQWLQRLHEYGLLRGSFRPQGEIATLRAYLRQRERLLDSAASHIQHRQKALMQMNLQLHHVVSDVTGVTGMTIIRAFVAGERDPAVLAAHRDPRCHASVDTIRQALVGNDREEHVFALTQAVELYDAYQEKVAACDQRIEAVLTRLRALAAKPVGKLPPTRHTTKQPNAPAFDARAALHAILGVDLTHPQGSEAKSMGSGRPWRSSWWASAGRIYRHGPVPSILPPGYAWRRATRSRAAKSCRRGPGAQAAGPQRCSGSPPQQWAAPRRPWALSTDVYLPALVRPRRSRQPRARSQCCSTTPYVRAWTISTLARPTMRNAIGAAC